MGLHRPALLGHADKSASCLVVKSLMPACPEIRPINGNYLCGIEAPRWVNKTPRTSICLPQSSSVELNAQSRSRFSMPSAHVSPVRQTPTSTHNVRMIHWPHLPLLGRSKPNLDIIPESMGCQISTPGIGKTFADTQAIMIDDSVMRSEHMGAVVCSEWCHPLQGL